MRERAKLSEKQERILVQCQLMGLTPRDVQQISNRLIALQKEAEYRSEVGNVISGMSWEKIGKDGWKIVDRDGKIYECTKHKSKRSKQSYWESALYVWDIKISKPGTRFKEKYEKDVRVQIDYYITAKLCPEGNKDLYALMKQIHIGRIT